MDELIFERDCLRHDFDAISEAYNALVPQLAEARAWMREARRFLPYAEGSARNVDIAGLIARCPLPEEDDDDV